MQVNFILKEFLHPVKGRHIVKHICIAWHTIILVVVLGCLDVSSVLIWWLAMESNPCRLSLSHGSFPRAHPERMQVNVILKEFFHLVKGRHVVKYICIAFHTIIFVVVLGCPS